MKNEWQPIETAERRRLDPPMVALASFYEHRDEDGEFTGEVTCRWLAIGCWFLDSWKARSGAQRGVVPGNDWIDLKDPTHWSELPDPPERVREEE